MSPKTIRQQVIHPLLSKSDVYHYSGYWGTWSRVLTSYDDPAGVLELNLTPVNPSSRSSWDNDVCPVIFRNHFTAFDPRRDLLLEKLPASTRLEMEISLGDELAAQLLDTDWLSLLDMAAVRRGNRGGGGLPFADCMSVLGTGPLEPVNECSLLRRQAE